MVATNINPRKKLVIANWKLNGNLKENASLLASLKDIVTADAVGVGVCVPFPYLYQVQQLLSATSVSWGAQDVSMHQDGAYTGEVSASMLTDFACKWVLCGHSERRAYHGETSATVAAKAKIALGSGLHPVVCLGETLEQRNDSLVKKVIARQLEPVLALADELHINNLVIAYEPVWAIGTGHTASPEQAQEVHEFIRSELKLNNLEYIRIIYGGSVKPDNAATLFAQPDIDGALVGGASLVARSFADIVLAANS